jgi:enoyl-CoA hydratase/carnithine racemase
VAPRLLRLALPRRLSWAEVDRLARALGSAPEARLVALAGEPDVFCEGGALDDPEEPRPRRFAALLAALERDPRPVIALVDGAAMGAGVGLAAAADLVLATPRARFALPETLLGLIPAMVFPVLARRLGVPRARALALGGEPLSAQDAHRCGLVDEVTEDLEAALLRHARRLSRMDPQALALVKGLVAGSYPTPAGYEEPAAAALLDQMRRPETQERIRRFLAGDTPWPEEGGS